MSSLWMTQFQKFTSFQCVTFYCWKLNSSRHAGVANGRIWKIVIFVGFWYFAENWTLTASAMWTTIFQKQIFLWICGNWSFGPWNNCKWQNFNQFKFCGFLKLWHWKINIDSTGTVNTYILRTHNCCGYLKFCWKLNIFIMPAM